MIVLFHYYLLEDGSDTGFFNAREFPGLIMPPGSPGGGIAYAVLYLE